MHILMTADTLGGVWTYSVELATGLAHRGHRVTLVAFGPEHHQASELAATGNIEVVRAPFALEWMNRTGTAAESERELAAARGLVAGLAQQRRPDILHCNQFGFVGCAPQVPSLLVAHSDIVSWWRAVYGTPPPDNGFQNWYRRLVQTALAEAALVVAPSQAVVADVAASYGFHGPVAVVANGRWPSRLNPHAPKEALAASIGRIWDSSKQAFLLCRPDLGMEMYVIGSTEHPHLGPRPLPQVAGVHLTGALPPARVNRILAAARVYVATSRYEPFGLAPLEGALSRCALLLNDIPSFREIWGDAALYFATNDGGDLARQLRRLAEDAGWARAWGQAAYTRARQRYAAPQMVEAYLGLYAGLRPGHRADVHDHLPVAVEQ